MNDIHLDDAFPATPARFEERMRHTLIHLEELSMRRKKRATIALALALAAALALAGAAYAAARQSGILDRLFRGATPPAAVNDLVVNPQASDSQNGLTLTIDEYLFDGASLHFGWTVSSALPDTVYCLAEYQIDTDADAADGALGAYGSDGVGDGVMAALGGTMNGVALPISRSDYAGFAYGQATPTAPVTATVTIHAFTSALTPKPADEVHFDDENRAAAGQIGVTGDGLCSVAQYPAYAAALSALSPTLEDFDAAAVRAFETSGLMKRCATLTAVVEIEPPAIAPSAAYAPIALPGKTIEVRYARFSAAATAIEYDIYLDAEPPEDNYMDGNLYIVADADGNNLSIGLGLSLSADLEVDADGRKYIHVLLSGDPAAQPPSAIRLIPLASLSDPEHPSPVQRNRHAIDAADPANVATIEIQR